MEFSSAAQDSILFSFKCIISKNYILQIFCQLQTILAMYTFACLFSSYLPEYPKSQMLLRTPKYSTPSIIIIGQSSTGTLIYSPTYRKRPIKMSHFMIQMTWSTKTPAQLHTNQAVPNSVRYSTQNSRNHK